MDPKLLYQPRLYILYLLRHRLSCPPSGRPRGLLTGPGFYEADSDSKISHNPAIQTTILGSSLENRIVFAR